MKNFKSFCHFLFYFCSLSLLANQSFAQAKQSTTELEMKVKAFLLEKIGQQSGKVSLKVGKVDPRLSLAQCKQNELKIFLPPTVQIMRATTVGIRCSAPKPWTIYLPVGIKIFSKAVITTRQLPRGTIISKNDIKISDVETNTLGTSYFQNPAQLIGKIAIKSIASGNVIHAESIRLPAVITRGQLVTIIAGKGAIHVTMQGVALNNGALGQVIRVKSNSNQRVINAKVIGHKKVRVSI